jgi:hypothetical protein
MNLYIDGQVLTNSTSIKKYVRDLSFNVIKECISTDDYIKFKSLKPYLNVHEMDKQTIGNILHTIAKTKDMNFLQEIIELFSHSSCISCQFTNDLMIHGVPCEVFLRTIGAFRNHNAITPRLIAYFIDNKCEEQAHQILKQHKDKLCGRKFIFNIITNLKKPKTKILMELYKYHSPKTTHSSIFKECVQVKNWKMCEILLGLLTLVEIQPLIVSNIMDDNLEFFKCLKNTAHFSIHKKIICETICQFSSMKIFNSLDKSMWLTFKYDDVKNMIDKNSQMYILTYFFEHKKMNEEEIFAHMKNVMKENVNDEQSDILMWAHTHIVSQGKREYLFSSQNFIMACCNGNEKLCDFLLNRYLDCFSELKKFLDNEIRCISNSLLLNDVDSQEQSIVATLPKLLHVHSTPNKLSSLLEYALKNCADFDFHYSHHFLFRYCISIANGYVLKLFSDKFPIFYNYKEITVDNVPVGQAEVTIYRAEIISDVIEIDEDCIICYEKATYRTPCNHHYCGDCVSSLENVNKCPLCGLQHYFAPEKSNRFLTYNKVFHMPRVNLANNHKIKNEIDISKDFYSIPWSF